MVRSPTGPGTAANQSGAANLVAARTFNAQGPTIPQDQQQPQPPKELPESYRNPEDGGSEQNFPGYVNDQQPTQLPNQGRDRIRQEQQARQAIANHQNATVLLNQAIGRDRMRQAAQEQDFPEQPFLRNPVKKREGQPPPMNEPPGWNTSRPAGFQGGQSPVNAMLALPGPPTPAKPPPELPGLSVAGPASPFGIALAKNLPDGVMDCRSLVEQVQDVDPFDALHESLMQTHREQIRIIIAENQELKEKLNAVLMAQWQMNPDGDEATGETKGGTQPLHLTTQVPGYLQNSWLWTVTEDDRAKDLINQANVRFKLLPGWFQPEDFTEEAKGLITSEGMHEQLGKVFQSSQEGRNIPRISRRLFIITPDSFGRLCWDICGMFLLLYDVLAIPLAAFDPDENWFTKGMDWITLCFWTGDMLASFVTGYVHNGETIMNPGQIAVHYLSKWFWLDALIVLPDWTFTLLGLLVKDSANSGGSATSLAGLLRVFRAIRVVRLLRLAKLKRLVQMVKDKITSETVFLVVFVLQILVGLLFANHFVGSLWYLIGHLAKENDDSDNWIEKQGIQDRSLFYRYAASYQWSMSNFGLGSVRIFPENSGERFFAIVVLVTGMFMFSLMTASVTSSMVRLQNMNAENATQFWLLRRYLRQNRVPNALAFRLLRFLEYKVGSKTDLIDETRLSLLNNLSESLRRELKCSVNFGSLFHGHPVFVRGFEISEVVMHSLADEVLQFKHIAEGDGLFTKGYVATHMYWACSGTQVYNKKGNDPVEVLCGDWLCEAALWVSWACRGDVIAVNDATYITVNSQQFAEVMQANEVIGALMSGYGEIFCTWLNEEPFEELTDYLPYNKGGRLVQKFVDKVATNIKQRDKEEQHAKAEEDRKAAKQAAERQRRIAAEASRMIQ